MSSNLRIMIKILVEIDENKECVPGGYSISPKMKCRIKTVGIKPAEIGKFMSKIKVQPI